MTRLVAAVWVHGQVLEAGSVSHSRSLDKAGGKMRVGTRTRSKLHSSSVAAACRVDGGGSVGSMKCRKDGGECGRRAGLWGLGWKSEKSPISI